MVVKVFISSHQDEFSEEREYLYEELKNDPSVGMLSYLFLRRAFPEHSLPMKYF